MKRIYILLPVYNRKEVTQRFIKCLKLQNYKNYHLILIDDASIDGTADMVLDEIPAATLIKGNGSWWWAGALHQGYQWLNRNQVDDSDIVLFINDDTLFEPDFLDKATLLLQVHPHSLILAQCYSQQTMTLSDSGVHIDWKYLKFEQAGSPTEINCLSTRGLFLTMADLKSIGGFHPTLLPHYFSDYEFTIRAYRKGLHLITNPRLTLIIDETTTGYHSLQGFPLFQKVKKLFSKKSVSNPIYFSIFIVLACPWQWKLISLLRVWKFTMTILFKHYSGEER